MWADAQRDRCPEEYRWLPLRKFRNSIPCTMPQHSGWRPLLECRAVTLPIYENATLGRKVNTAAGKIPLRGKSPQKCIYSVPAQEMAKHRAKFCWPLVSDVAVVTKPRRETRWNLLECSKLQNRSQPLVGRSSLYYQDMWRRYCCNKFFPIVNICLSCQDIAVQSCAMVPRWRFFASCIFSQPRAAHFRHAFDICTKDTPCVEVW